MKVVIMDEPNKGVLTSEPGQKSGRDYVEIWAKKGYAIIPISEMPETSRSWRTAWQIVMCNGRKTGELEEEEATRRGSLELAMKRGLKTMEKKLLVKTYRISWSSACSCSDRPFIVITAINCLSWLRNSGMDMLEKQCGNNGDGSGYIKVCVMLVGGIDIYYVYLALSGMSIECFKNDVIVGQYRWHFSLQGIGIVCGLVVIQTPAEQMCSPSRYNGIYVCVPAMAIWFPTAVSGIRRSGFWQL